MKEGNGDQSSSRNGNGNVRSAAEKERTKLREKLRRSITTKIFHGLRKHGGYRLSPRADINQVLRHLAQEAGWVIEPDGTTYRSHSSIITSNGVAVCPLCGNSSFMNTIGGGGDVTNAINGECSTTASPRRTMNNVGDPILKFNFGSSEATTLYPSSVFSSSSLPETYMHGEGRCGGDGGPQISSSSTLAQGLHPYIQETRASNQNTPVGYPQLRS